MRLSIFFTEGEYIVTTTADEEHIHYKGYIYMFINTRNFRGIDCQLIPNLGEANHPSILPCCYK